MISLNDGFATYKNMISCPFNNIISKTKCLRLSQLLIMPDKLYFDKRSCSILSANDDSKEIEKLIIKTIDHRDNYNHIEKVGMRKDNRMISLNDGFATYKNMISCPFNNIIS